MVVTGQVISCKLGGTCLLGIPIALALRASYYLVLSSLDIRLEKSENGNPALQKISSRLRDMTIHLRFKSGFHGASAISKRTAAPGEHSRAGDGPGKVEASTEAMQIGDRRSEGNYTKAGDGRNQTDSKCSDPLFTGKHSDDALAARV